MITSLPSQIHITRRNIIRIETSIAVRWHISYTHNQTLRVDGTDFPGNGELHVHQY